MVNCHLFFFFFQHQLKYCLNNFHSVDEFESFIEKINASLSNLEQTNKKSENRVPLRVIVVNDKSEIRPITKRRQSHTKDAGRAHSTARDHKKHSRKHKKREEKGEKGEDNIVKLEVMQEAHRNGTLSPVRDGTEIMIMTPSSSETSNVQHKENLLISQRYHETPAEEDPENDLVNIE